MEITLENKYKFFAQYLGQKYFYSNEWGKFNDNVGSLNQYKNMENATLVLKAIDSISDIDAINVSKIVYPIKENWSETMQNKYKGEDFINCTFYSDEYTFSVFGINNPFDKINSVIDYLRSKGYALPWMGLSISEMVQSGWIKLKNK